MNINTMMYIVCTAGQGNNEVYFVEAAYLHDKEDVEIRVSDKTICMVSTQGNNNEYQHYDVHSLYGWSQTEPTLK